MGPGIVVHNDPGTGGIEIFGFDPGTDPVFFAGIENKFPLTEYHGIPGSGFEGAFFRHDLLQSHHAVFADDISMTAAEFQIPVIRQISGAVFEGGVVEKVFELGIQGGKGLPGWPLFHQPHIGDIHIVHPVEQNGIKGSIDTYIGIRGPERSLEELPGETLFHGASGSCDNGLLPVGQFAVAIEHDQTGGGILKFAAADHVIEILGIGFEFIGPRDPQMIPFGGRLDLQDLAVGRIGPADFQAFAAVVAPGVNGAFPCGVRLQCGIGEEVLPFRKTDTLLPRILSPCAGEGHGTEQCDHQ